MVCEGKCNPDLVEFEQLCERWMMFGDNREYLVERRKALRHTVHVSNRPECFDTKMGGWTRVWRCTECGAVRRG